MRFLFLILFFFSLTPRSIFACEGRYLGTINTNLRGTYYGQTLDFYFVHFYLEHGANKKNEYLPNLCFRYGSMYENASYHILRKEFSPIEINEINFGVLGLNLITIKFLPTLLPMAGDKETIKVKISTPEEINLSGIIPRFKGSFTSDLILHHGMRYENHWFFEPADNSYPGMALDTIILKFDTPHPNHFRVKELNILRNVNDLDSYTLFSKQNIP